MSKSDKKKEKLLSGFRSTLYIVILAVNIIFLLLRYFFAWETFTTGRQYAYWVILFLTVVFSWLLLSARSNSRVLDLQKDGGEQPGSKYIDILGLIFFVQLASIYSDNMWYFFLIVPFTIIYYAIKRWVTWVFTPQASDFEEENPSKPRRERKHGNKHARFRQ